MTVLVHIYNNMDDLRGGYITPVEQAMRYQRHDVLFLYTSENLASRLADDQGLATVILENQFYSRFFDTLRLERFSLAGLYSYLSHTIALIRIIRSKHIRIVHVQNFESLILCWAAARLTRCRLLLHVRGDGPFARVRLLLYLPDAIIAVSESLRDSMLASFSGRALTKLREKLVVIENGIQTQPAHTSPNSESINVAIIGAIHDVKGQLDFLRNVWMQTNQLINKTARLYLIGSEKDLDYCGELRSEIARNISADVVLTGLQEDMASWYRRLHIVVIYSTLEGLPRVGLEAMSYGIPILGTRIVGNVDLIVDGHNGFLVDSGDPAVAAKLLASLINDDQLRMQFGRNAAATVMSGRFSIDTSAENIERLYDSVL